MDPIMKAKELGEAIQEDVRYKAFMEAQAAHDNDAELQNLLQSFTETRDALIAERQADQPDEAKCAALNETMRAFYNEVIENETMMQFMQAKQELDSLVNQVNGIINFYITGEEPSSCGGNCGSCGGCH